MQNRTTMYMFARNSEKIVFLERKDTETQRFILNNSKETKNAPCGALAFKKIIHDDQKFKPENDILRIRKKRKARFFMIWQQAAFN
jgi:hypothetical protein